MALRLYCFISGLFFALATALHVARVVERWPVAIGPLAVESGWSIPGALFTGAMMIWAFWSARKIPGASGRVS
jgi:hypothetical protein